MVDPRICEQGAILWLDFEEKSGHEIYGRRPAIVVSNKIFNEKRHFAVVCPITNPDRDDPLQIHLDDRTKTTGVVLADQVRSVDLISRNPEYIERAPENITMEALDIIAAITEAL